ncbi:CLUMA_CG009394, isoform A [Clunio marinus]|uniref:CLUMA_CG009394, isoform A n=1 Tax=Clunio marinus TaxID=568069 RepID=A0A1J1IAG5_9DIPT|nr:CLUMA_CG009394, isoform A [Clunio marinus]
MQLINKIVYQTRRRPVTDNNERLKMILGLRKLLCVGWIMQKIVVKKEKKVHGTYRCQPTRNFFSIFICEFCLSYQND